MSFSVGYTRDATNENIIHLKIVRVATDVNKPPITIDWGDGNRTLCQSSMSAPALADVQHTYNKAGMRDVVVQESGGVRATVHVITGKFRVIDPETRDKTQQQLWAEERAKARDIQGQLRVPQ